MGGSGRDDARREGAFPGERDLSTPGNAVVVAGGGVVPVSVEAVVGGAVARRLVLGDRFSACRKGFQVG